MRMGVDWCDMRTHWNALDWLASVLVITGGVNWGLVGLFDFNLVETIFGSTISPVIYGLVGLSALYMIYSAIKAGQMSSQLTPRSA